MMKGYLESCHGIVLVVLFGFMAGAAAPPNEDALRIERLLSGIARQAHQSHSQERRTEVSQQDLNAYIAYQLSREDRPSVDSFKVDLLDNSRVKGIMHIDPQQLQLDAILGDRLIVEVTGILLSRNAAARLNLIALKLNGQIVKPQVLDFVIGTIAHHHGWEWNGIEGWYALPAGVKRMIVRRDKLVLVH